MTVLVFAATLLVAAGAALVGAAVLVARDGLVAMSTVRPMSDSFLVDAAQRVDRPQAWLLGVSGDLDASTVDRFEAAVDEVVSAGGRLVLLDLTAVTFLDSTGLRGIIRASSLLTGRGGRLTLSGLSGAAQRVLELTGLLEGLREQAPDNDDGACDPSGSATAGH